MNGAGVDKNLQRAFVLFSNAAQQGDVEGQALLGKCYLDGIGIAKDPRRAIRLLKDAIKQGSVPAKHSLAICLKT